MSKSAAAEIGRYLRGAARDFEHLMTCAVKASIALIIVTVKLASCGQIRSPLLPVKLLIKLLQFGPMPKSHAGLVRCLKL